MIVDRPPLGWNTWNTFGADISEDLVLEIADLMVSQGYLDSGYEYLVIDDCWSLHERDENGLLVPDPQKFPHGMKYIADCLHKKGLKFGMYSCAGVETCAGYPSSYDHEFTDARTFASWNVDFLKYDFCNFPESGDCRTRYATMSMALKASGRDILFSACNWGQKEPWKWMNSVGANMYRSTGDILDNYTSFTEIFKSQLDNFCMSAKGCFNDMDMLTVGLCGKGNVGLGKICTYEEYRMQFSLWCLAGAPLMIGADLRKLAPEYKNLMQNRDLLRIDQDEECRPPFLIRRGDVYFSNPEAKEGEVPWTFVKDSGFTFVRYLSGNEFVLAMINMAPSKTTLRIEFADIGLPVTSGLALDLRDVYTGERIGRKSDIFGMEIPAHDMRMYIGRIVSSHE